MLRIFNSLSRKVEDFTPLNPPHVGMYTCGPTVYHFAHIGNFRTYLASDILVRTLKFNKYEVEYVMNLTDVGHLTGDNAGDADTGEDRMEKAAAKEGKTAWEVAKFYTDAFLEDYKSLNLTPPDHLVRATDHIKEQIALVQMLDEKGYTYQTSDGIYFDTSKFKDYGKLSDLDEIKEGARIEVNPEKRNPRDFALWKFSPAHEKRQMEWQSPWGVGFPGWHIECSAMSMKYLGETLDIHAGGMDLKQTHHPNEIAQSEAATGKEFARYWMHVAFILVQGERMSKSVGNVYRVYDLIKKGYHPMSLRYLYLQTHYRKELNFTFPSLDAAENALMKLYTEVAKWDGPSGNVPTFESRFIDAINDDLNTAEALAAMWELVKSDYPMSAKMTTLLKMDEVLGLEIGKSAALIRENTGIIPKEVAELVKEREHLRKNRKFSAADHVRAQIKKLGYEVEDSEKGPKVKKI